MRGMSCDTTWLYYIHVALIRSLVPMTGSEYHITQLPQMTCGNADYVSKSRSTNSKTCHKAILTFDFGLVDLLFLPFLN